jgi:hypothetical protein
MNNLFGEQVKVSDLPRDKKARIAIQQWRQLIQIYGKADPKTTCKNCVHLHRKSYSKTYLKCALASNSNSPATDWRAGWVACGRYEVKPKK